MKELLTVILLFGGALGSTQAQTFPKTEPIWGYGFTNAFPHLVFKEPVRVVAPPGEMNRLFVVERAGKILVIPDLRDASANVFLELTNTFSQGIEAGLLGLAFHPGYATNGRFFTFRTVVTNGLRCELAEFRVSPSNPNVADRLSETVLISQQDGSDAHNAGDLKFGPDGYLYVAFGEAAPVLEDAHEEMQAIDKGFFGGIIRIDVDNRAENLPPNPHRAVVGAYRIPRDNPFVGATNFNGGVIDPGKVRTEFYAVGLRNPWRFTFDRATGDMICADVGAGYYEEVNIIEAGGNYGWPFLEANYRREPDMPAGLRAPLYEYLHGKGNYEGHVVIGGVVVESELLGGLRGQYIFADFQTGNMWSMNTRARETNAVWLTARRGITSFGIDPRDGGVLTPNLISGRIEKLVYRAPEELGIPTQLSEWEVFESLPELRAKPGVMPYEVINPLWSDGAVKQRWVSLAHANGKIDFSAREPWKYPVGAYWVKHFELELTNGVPESRRRLETRFLVQGAEGVYGLSYRWGSSTEEATLLPPYPTNEVFLVNDGGLVRTQVWTYPGWQQCKTCHTEAAGGVLSFNTYQLNRNIERAGTVTNQLDWFAGHDFFTDPEEVEPGSLPNFAAIDDPHAPPQHKVRSYLASNCAHCHQPGNELLGPKWDGRISTALAAANIVNADSFFYPPPMKLIAPRSETNSFILARSSSRGSNHQMPPIGTNERDAVYLAALREWINSMPDETWKFANIGSTLAEGSAEQLPGTVRLHSAGTGLRNHSVYFAYRPASGVSELVGKVAAFRAASSQSEAGLIFRKGLAVGGAYVAVVIRNGAVWLQQWAGNGVVEISGGIPFSAGAWLKLTSGESGVSAWISNDGLGWIEVGRGESLFEQGETVNGGFFVASAAPAVRFAAAEFAAMQLYSVRLTTPMTSPVLLPQAIPLEGAVTAVAGVTSRMAFYSDGILLGVATTAPYRVTWTNPPAGEAQLTAVLEHAHGAVTSNPVALELQAPESTLWAISVDRETRGNWPGRYGGVAYLMPAVETNLPAGVEIRVLDAQNPLKQPSSDEAALAWGEERFHTLLPGRAVLEIQFRAADFAPRRAAIYFHDWVELGEQQIVTFLKDGTTVSEVTTVRSGTGTYATFVFRGEIVARIENPLGTAHLSAAFIDSVEELSVAIVSPLEDAIVQQPGEVRFEIAADAPGREVTQVELRDNGKLVARFDEAPYSITLSNLLAGEHYLNAVAHGTFGLSGISELRRVTVKPPASVAEFLGTDERTLGSWKERYGEAGYWIIGGDVAIPDSIALEVDGANTFVFSNSSSDARALEPAGGGPRSAACLAGHPEFEFEVKVLDGEPAVLGFYCLDWDRAGRIMDAEAMNPDGMALDARRIADFAGGKYLFWRVRGNVRFRFSSESINPVVSALFVDRGLTGFDFWRNATFTAEDLNGMGTNFEVQDFDGDGFSNILEYALGFDARRAEDKPRFSFEVEAGFAHVTVSRRMERTDWKAAFEVSADLTGWSRLPIPSETGGDEWNFRIPVSGAREFYRLGVARE